MPTDAELLMRAINAPPVLGELSAATAVPYTDAYSFAGPGKQLAIKDAQGIANAVAAWRRVANQAPANRFAGVVFGDTPGGAQSQLLNLRGQNIAIAENAARMQQARELAAQQNARLQEANAANNARLREYYAGRLAQDAAATEARRYGDELDYQAALARAGGAGTTRSTTGTTRSGAATTSSGLPPGTELAIIAAQSRGYDSKLADLLQQKDALLAEASDKAQNWFYDSNLENPYAYSVEYTKDGFPELAYSGNTGDPRGAQKQFKDALSESRAQYVDLAAKINALKEQKNSLISNLELAKQLGYKPGDYVTLSGVARDALNQEQSSPSQTARPPLPISEAAQRLIDRNKPKSYLDRLSPDTAAAYKFYMDRNANALRSNLPGGGWYGQAFGNNPAEQLRAMAARGNQVVSDFIPEPDLAATLTNSPIPAPVQMPAPVSIPQQIPAAIAHSPAAIDPIQALVDYANSRAGIFEKPRQTTAFGTPALFGWNDFDPASALAWIEDRIRRLSGSQIPRDQQQLAEIKAILSAIR